VLTGEPRIATAPVSFGIWSEAIPAPADADHLLAEVSAMGFEGIEITPFAFFGRDARSLRARLKRFGLRPAGAFAELPLFTAGHRAVDLMQRVASYVGTVGDELPLIVADAGDPPRQKAAGQAANLRLTAQSARRRRVAIDWLRRAAASAADAGVEVAVHPHAGTHFELPEEIEELLELTAADGLGICLDTGHAILSGLDPVQFIHDCDGRVRHVHIKDVSESIMLRLTRGELTYEAAWRQGLWPDLGRGPLDLPSVLRALDHNRYNGWLVLEQDRFTVTSDELGGVAAIEAQNLGIVESMLAGVYPASHRTPGRE
jgi:inosose dehydratase